jgi:hypothetical protein
MDYPQRVDGRPGVFDDHKIRGSVNGRLKGIRICRGPIGIEVSVEGNAQGRIEPKIMVGEE